ncbi:MAG: hypothetical protein ACI32N_00510 [Bulleidia sp.]
MNQIVDFVMAALPWTAMGLFLAFVFARNRDRLKNGETPQDYSIEGMCLGMCIGTAIGTALGNNTGIGISMGMLLGLAAGTAMKKQQ